MAKIMTTRIAARIITPFCELRFDRLELVAATLEARLDGPLAIWFAKGL
jgi:hypothetical protein